MDDYKRNINIFVPFTQFFRTKNTEKSQNHTASGEKSVKISLLERTSPGSLVFKPHCHLRLEFLRVISGELIVTVNQKKIIAKAGSIVVVNPYNMHTGFSGKNGVVCYAVMFDADKLYNDSTLTQNYLIPLREQLIVLSDYLEDDDIINEIDRLIEFSENNSLCTLGSVYMLLGLFFNKGYCHSNIKIPTNEKFYEIVNYINRYVGHEDGHTVDLSVPGIANTFGYNQSYLCRKFKEYTGFTVTNYVNLLRLEKAQVLLATTDKPISVISYRSGFNDLVYFSHCFKKQFGVSPSTFRKENSAPLNYIP